MIPVVSVENMRKSDAHTIKNFISSKELMYNAGKSVFENVDWKEPVAIVCGNGNNAGDGYVVAQFLHDAHIACDIVLLSEKFSDDGLYYFNICKEKNIKVIIWNGQIDLSRYKMIVDCIYGTGFQGTVNGSAREVIESINKSGAYIVSIDINSGLNGDTGIADLCVHSDITLSIGGFKTGHFLNMAKDVMKQKCNCDINIRPIERTYNLIESKDLHELFSGRKNFSNKGTYGYIALIGGSKEYSGAIRLAYMSCAAMRAGAGVVKIALPNSLCHYVIPSILESILYPISDKDGELEFVHDEISKLINGVKVIAFGMGIGVSQETFKILEYIIFNYEGTLIIDADGLTLLSQFDVNRLKEAKCKFVLTPHLKEFSRLTGDSVNEILSAPISKVEEYAKLTNSIVLLKGPTSIITDGHITYLVDAGCAGMATAGSGDVLSGIVAAICASSVDLPFAVAAAAYVNGKAGEFAQEKYGSISMIARDTIESIPNVIKQLGECD